MYAIHQTEQFSKWLHKLKDIKGKVAILRRIDRIQQDNFGDVKPVGDGIEELRVMVGAGYRVYFIKEDEKIVILLNGGDKSTQKSDIAKAKVLAKEYRK